MAKKTTKKPSIILGEDITLDDDLDVAHTKDEIDDMFSPKEEVTHEVHEVSMGDFESLLADVDTSAKYLKMLLYGRNGTGKTHFVGTANKTLLLGPEDGTRTLKGKGFKGKFVHINTFDKFEQAYWYLAKEAALPASKRKFDTVAVDTLTRLVQVCLRHEVMEAQKRSVVDEAVISLTQRDYGNMTQRIFYWLGNMFALPYNFIILCQERTTTDDADMAEYQGFPDLPRALRNLVLGDMEIVGRLYVDRDAESKPRFRMTTHPSDMYWTKDRTGSIGRKTNPNFEEILKIYRGV